MFGKKGSKILKLPPVLNCFTLAMTSKLVVVINSLKVPKIKKTLLYEMKFLVRNYSCLRNPRLGGYRPRIPVLSVLCPQLNLLNLPRTKFLGTPLAGLLVRWKNVRLLVLLSINAFSNAVLKISKFQISFASRDLQNGNIECSKYHTSPLDANLSQFHVPLVLSPSLSAPSPSKISYAAFQTPLLVFSKNLINNSLEERKLAKLLSDTIYLSLHIFYSCLRGTR